MTKVGKLNKLKIIREVDFGVYLDGLNLGDILLPRRYVPKDYKLDDFVIVFVYTDSEDRIIATTETPLAMVGDLALLKVVSVSAAGAFLDWGLQKDLLVPFSEQNKKMRKGQSYVVKLFLDDQTNRVAASSKLEKFLSKDFPKELEREQEVELLICDKSDLGYKAIVNDLFSGMIYKNEIYEPLKIGSHKKGFIKKVREDGKIDISLYKVGYEKVTGLSDKIICKLKEENGFIPVTDKSPPEVIYKIFGASKKTFKKAIGALYKKRVINLEKEGIRLKGQVPLVEDPPEAGRGIQGDV